MPDSRTRPFGIRTDRRYPVSDVPAGFYVADDGPGIPEDERDEIFEHGYSTGTEGSGLGLTIVEHVVSAHGWTIDVMGGRIFRG